ncbi:MAG TPA: hypothetical protein VFK01_08280, partial [Bradyrhizobium sp.]|nr:hypothetical protein [Bradyrhizobium sp.]
MKIARALIAHAISIRVPHRRHCGLQIKFAFTSEADARPRWTKIERRPDHDHDSIRGCEVALNLGVLTR